MDPPVVLLIGSPIKYQGDEPDQHWQHERQREHEQELAEEPGDCDETGDSPELDVRDVSPGLDDPLESQMPYHE